MTCTFDGLALVGSGIGKDSEMSSVVGEMLFWLASRSLLDSFIVSWSTVRYDAYLRKYLL